MHWLIEVKSLIYKDNIRKKILKLQVFLKQFDKINSLNCFSNHKKWRTILLFDETIPSCVCES